MKLIIIEGPSSTGKSTLARKLSKDLKIPAFLRDDYKEQQYDTLGKNPSLKQLAAIDAASRRELIKAIQEAIAQDTSLIVESNFMHKEARVMRRLIRSNTTVVEIFCHANGFKVLRRYVDRNKKGDRHPGHRDHLWYGIVALEALGPIYVRYRPFRLSSNILKVNTNDFTHVDYDAIHKFVVSAKRA